MNDPITGPTAETCAQFGLTGEVPAAHCDDEEVPDHILEAARPSGR
jgi:hypothetical protein